jgi:DNA replication protein DnaC
MGAAMKDDDLDKMLTYLGVRSLRERFSEYVSAGEKQDMSHDKFLRYVVSESHAAKLAYAKEMRLLRARIPEPWVMETFPFSRQPKLNKKRVMNIYDSMSYMEEHQNIVLIGPTGCGKTGLGTSYLMRAIEKNYTAYFTTFPDLIGTLYRSMAAHQEDRLLKRLAAYDCIAIDELGYVEVEPAQVGLFFRLMTMRHRRKTTIVTSNLGFLEWASFLKHAQLTAALIDRLTESSHVINMKQCISLRPKGLKPEAPSEK